MNARQPNHKISLALYSQGQNRIATILEKKIHPNFLRCKEYCHYHQPNLKCHKQCGAYDIALIRIINFQNPNQNYYEVADIKLQNNDTVSMVGYGLTVSREKASFKKSIGDTWFKRQGINKIYKSMNDYYIINGEKKHNHLGKSVSASSGDSGGPLLSNLSGDKYKVYGVASQAREKKVSPFVPLVSHIESIYADITSEANYIFIKNFLQN